MQNFEFASAIVDSHVQYFSVRPQVATRLKFPSQRVDQKELFDRGNVEIAEQVKFNEKFATVLSSTTMSSRPLA